MGRQLLRFGVAAGLALSASCFLYQIGCGDGETGSNSPGIDAGAMDVVLEHPADGRLDRQEEADSVSDVKAEEPLVDAGDAAWLSDPDGWTELTDNLDWLAPCRLWRGDLSKLEVPGLTWQSCGTGCESALLAGGIGDVISPISSGTMVGDIPIGHTRAGIPGDPPVGVSRLLRLDTGEVLATHRFQHMLDAEGFSHCGFGARDHPLLMMINGPNSDRQALFVASLSEPWRMVPHPVGVIGELTYLDGLPGLVSSGVAGVIVSQTLQPPSFEVVFEGLNGGARALGTQTVFADWRGTGQNNGKFGRIQSWTPSTGLQELLAPKYDPFTVALSDTRLVWLSFPEILDYYPTNTTMKARFHWSPRASTAAELEPHDGAEIPKSPPRVDWTLQTRGDYAAIVSGDQKEDHELWRTAITNLSTGQLWMLKARDPLNIPITIWAVSDTHVYVVEGLAYMRRQVLVRYEIAHLDALATGE